MRATVTERLLSKLKRKSYRENFVANEVRTGLAYQIRALREQRDWSQDDLAKAMGTQQSVVSRLEDPDYGRVTLQTMLDVARAFDVAFMARYCSFPEMIYRSSDVSPDALRVPSFSEGQLCSLGRRTEVNVEVGSAPPPLPTSQTTQIVIRSSSPHFSESRDFAGVNP